MAPMGTTFGIDPVLEEVEAALTALANSEQVTETRHLDLKEEAGRRSSDGTVLSGQPRDETVAKQLAAEAACMANTPGGGALLVGVSDDSQIIGAVSDIDWLQHRIYQLTNRQLTAIINEVMVRESRILVIRTLPALEPVRFQGKIRWRLNDACEEIDATAWHERRRHQLGIDWSAQPSHLAESAARAGALELVREFLAESGEPGALELSALPVPDLLRRLNAVTGEGLLTNAAALALVGRAEPSIDYIHRVESGGDSTERVRRANRSLVEELNEVFNAFNARNPITHLGSGLSRGQIRAIPTRAAREAIVNGVAHRDWGIPEPTLVEHTANTLVVTSPGGFVGGVNSTNVLSHPSRSRNTALTDLLASLRIAEREGVGVDRMFRDSLMQGNRLPEIIQQDSPAVRVSLSGEVRDPAWSAWLSEIEPTRARSDLRWLMTLHRFVTLGWADIEALAPFLQTTPELAADVVAAMWSATISDHALLVRVMGTPTGTPEAWTLSGHAVGRLRELDELGAFRRTWPTPGEIALDYARARGRISSTELGSLLDRHPTNVGQILRDLEEEGSLSPSRPNRRGAGFYFRYTSPE